MFARLSLLVNERSILPTDRVFALPLLVLTNPTSRVVADEVEIHGDGVMSREDWDRLTYIDQVRLPYLVPGFCLFWLSRQFVLAVCVQQGKIES